MGYFVDTQDFHKLGPVGLLEFSSLPELLGSHSLGKENRPDCFQAAVLCLSFGCVYRGYSVYVCVCVHVFSSGKWGE